MNKPIPDYIEIFKGSFHKDIDIQLIENEIRLNPHDRELTRRAESVLGRNR